MNHLEIVHNDHLQFDQDLTDDGRLSIKILSKRNLQNILDQLPKHITQIISMASTWFALSVVHLFHYIQTRIN